MLRELLGCFEAFIQERFSQIKDAIEGYYTRAYDCPVCLQTAFMIEGDKATCLFCGHHAEGELAANQWTERFLPFQSMMDDLTEPQIRKCPDCEMEACIDIGYHIGSQPLFMCFVCGVEGNYHDCPTCGELCNPDGSGRMCDNCCDHFINKDN